MTRAQKGCEETGASVPQQQSAWKKHISEQAKHTEHNNNADTCVPVIWVDR